MRTVAYSCARTTKGWPLRVFFGMLNSDNTNSWIIRSENMMRRGSKPLERHKYIHVLALSLIVPWAQKRLNSPFLPHTLKTLICTACDSLHLPLMQTHQGHQLPAVRERWCAVWSALEEPTGRRATSATAAVNLCALATSTPPVPAAALQGMQIFCSYLKY